MASGHVKTNEQNTKTRIDVRNPRPWAFYKQFSIIGFVHLVLTQSFIVTLLLCAFLVDGKNEASWTCLPAGIDLEEIVSGPPVKSETNTSKPATIRQVLVRIKAHCKKGKLVDATGREIYFFRLIGCWGNPPADYEEQLASQQQELERLRKKYTVIKISCNQSGDPRKIS